MNNSLLVSDLHLSSAPRDEYRFAVFKRIREYALKVRHIFILGDLTDAKDYHAGRLVNRVCDSIWDITSSFGVEMHIVRGNHDGVDPEWPFFKFLRMIPRIHFYSEPTKLSNILVLPHSRNPDLDWAGVEVNTGFIAWVMMHATFKGAISESGIKLDGPEIPRQLRRSNAQIYSGDVHVPQKLGNVTYVGSPHHVHYGDKFEPRMIHIEKDGSEESIPLPGMRRLMLDITSVRDLRRVECNKGDQAKVRLHLPEAALGKWQEMRKEIVVECRHLGLDVAAVELVRERSTKPLLRPRNARTPSDVLEDYLDKNKDADANVGRELLKIAQGE